MSAPIPVTPPTLEADVPKKLLIDLASGTQTMVPLTPEELQQRATDQAAAATQAVAASKVDAARAALVAKLAAGTATTKETQQALAQLLGGN